MALELATSSAETAAAHGSLKRPSMESKKTLGYFATYVEGLSHLFSVNETDTMR
jgi:hypothetical protein